MNPTSALKAYHDLQLDYTPYISFGTPSHQNQQQFFPKANL
jgi:hypothetical protein